MEIYNDTYCVYAHINKINGKIYIGQTINGSNPKRRWQNGIGYKSNKYFWRSIEKYGWDNFEHEVIASNLTKEEANNFEILLINKLNTTNPECGYNISLGGEGTPGVIPSNATKILISNKAKERCLDKDFIQQMRDVAPKKSVWQFDVSGKFIKEYISSKEAERQTGVTSGSICACSLRKIPSAGKFIWTYKDDADDINERVVKYKNTSLKKEPIIQLTLNGEFIKQWDNAAKAGREIGINYKNIHLVCRNIRRKAGECMWMYLSDYEKYLEKNN